MLPVQMVMMRAGPRSSLTRLLYRATAAIMGPVTHMRGVRGKSGQAAYVAVACVVMLGVTSGCSREDLLGPDDGPTQTMSLPVTTATSMKAPSVAPGRWSLDTRDARSAKTSLVARVESAGCEQAAVLSADLETAWKTWFGHTQRTAQAEYNDLVTTPLVAFAKSCGVDAAWSLYEQLPSKDQPMRDALREHAATQETSASPNN